MAQLKDHSFAENFSFRRFDIGKRESLEEFFQELGSFDAVINLAAGVGFVTVWKTLMSIFPQSPKAVSTYSIACANLDVASWFCHLLLPFMGQTMPFNEDLPVNEPLSPYAATKKAAELLAYSYHKLYGLDVSVVRYFTVFGPAGGRPDMAPYRFIRWIVEGETIQMFGDGSQSRDFTYVDDIASGTVAAIKKIGYEIINLGGGRNPVSLNAIIEKLESLIMKKAKVERKPFHLADLKETWADIAKAKRLFGWEPRVSLEEGLEKSVKWYMDNRQWLKEVPV